MLNHPYFAGCNNEDIVYIGNGGLSQKQTSDKTEFQSKNAKALCKSDDSWSDDMDRYMNDHVKQNNRHRVQNQQSNEKPYSYYNSQPLTHSNNPNCSDTRKQEIKKTIGSFTDSLYGLDDIYKHKFQGITPKVRTDTETLNQYYGSPKNEAIVVKPTRDASNALRFNTQSILEKTITPKKDSFINNPIPDLKNRSILNRYKSEKDVKDLILSSKHQPSNFSNTKKTSNEKNGSYERDGLQPGVPQKHKITSYRNNLNHIDDQIEELLSTPLYNNRRSSKNTEHEKNTNFVNRLLNKIPVDSDYKNSQSRLSYLNGITVLQNFEKSAIN